MLSEEQEADAYDGMVMDVLSRLFPCCADQTPPPRRRLTIVIDLGEPRNGSLMRKSRFLTFLRVYDVKLLHTNGHAERTSETGRSVGWHCF